MKLQDKLPLVTFVLLSACWSHVSATASHCSTDSIRDYAVDACTHLIEHISKRQTDLSDYGYSITSVKARHHHRHQFAKKLTNPRFPKGGYILVHYPLAHHIFASNNNQLDESALSNQLLSNDLPVSTETTTSGRRKINSVKNNYTFKFKRNANTDELYVEPCCSHSSKNTCAIHFCN